MQTAALSLVISVVHALLSGAAGFASACWAGVPAAAAGADPEGAEGGGSAGGGANAALFIASAFAPGT